MSNFLELIKVRENNARLEIGKSREESIAQVSSVLSGLSISSGTASNFAKQLTDVAKSPEFLKPVSDAIGTPKVGESEDEFVARGKAVIVQQLRKTFKLK